MKKILFIALALLAWSSSSYAAGWADTYTEDSSVAGTEKIFVENPTATGNNWMSLSTVKAYVLPDTLVGDCTVGPCLDGSTDGGNYIKLWAGTGSYWTALQGGAPAANRSWRLPTLAPPSAGETNVMTMDENGQMNFLDKPGTTGYVLSSTDAGVLSWAAPPVAMAYPGAGIPLSTGSAWGTSYSTTTLAAALDGEAWTFTGAVDLSGASSVLMGPLSFEGATPDAYETTFSITDPTADRTITVGNYDSEIPAATAVDSSGNILVAGIADSTTEALGLGTIELGHASDTTIARSGAGAITVEGVGVALTTSPVFSTSLALPQGASPTVDAAGEIAIDTTSDQLKFYGGAEKVLPSVQFVSFVIPGPVATDDINIMKAPYGMTITAVSCIVQGTTSVTGQIQECDSAGANCADTDSDITCDADGAADDGAFSNGVIDSADWIQWKTTSISGTPTFLTVTVKYAVVGD